MERERDVIDDETYTAGSTAAGADRPDLDYVATTDGPASTDAGVTPDGALDRHDDAPYRDDSYLDATDATNDAPDGAAYTTGTSTDAGLDEVEPHRGGHAAEALGAGAGAIGGAAIGMAVAGPPGAVIGGLVGAAAGAVAGEAADDDDDKPGTPGHPEDDGTINDGSVRDLTY
jgi:outer membrane protein with glycine zipper